MRAAAVTALLTFGLGTAALADGTVTEEYQGVWAAARDCSEGFQVILPNVVERRFAVCRVNRALGSPESTPAPST